MTHATYVQDRSANNRWRAYCSCGYHSLSYATRTAAEYEADLHTRTAGHNSH